MKYHNLIKMLKDNAASDIYPYHMPGHKRRDFGLLPEELYQMDITEIEGFDNLHQPEGILRKLQEEASQLYGAEESFYLVNGSTCGILSAVSAALPVGGRILMARCCHKSAYHAAYLRNLNIAYLYPPYLAQYDIFDAVEPQQIREALEQEQDIGAVLIVSPTYEGRIADVRKIAEVVHKKGIPLIVDEAHGAHLGLAEGFAPNSCQCGADLVIHSVHKTLPSLTQTALLHVNGKLIDRNLLRRFLHIYQSSSPSYLLMASIDNALKYIRFDGKKLFGQFKRLYEGMMKTLGQCRHLKFLPVEYAVQDVGKLLIVVKGTRMTGKQLYDIMLEKYHLQTEMASGAFVLAMFTINDREEAYRRMTETLLEIDAQLGEEETDGCRWDAVWEIPPIGVPLSQAWDMKTETIALEDSVGRCVGEFINLYPPGVPLLAPGERMTAGLCREILRYMEQGLTVQGIDRERGRQFSRGGIQVLLQEEAL